MPDEVMSEFPTSTMANLLETDWWRVGAALGVVLVFTVARRPIAKLFLSAIRACLSYFEFDVSDDLRLAVQRGAELFVFSLGLIAAIALVDFQGPLGDISNKISMSVLVIAIFSAAFESATLGAAVIAGSSRTRRTMNAGWIEKILKVIAVVLGIASVLGVWGIDIGPMLTGVGIAGAATALAAQDLFKNLIGGMSNMAEERFVIGDWIRAEGVAEGVVEDVSLRSTAVRQFDMTLVHIPNSALANAPLINVSKMKHRRIRVSVKLHCSTKLDQLSSITDSIRTFLSTSSEFAQPPAAAQHVVIESFSDEAINMLVYCFTRSTNLGDFLGAQESLMFAIRHAVTQANAKFAFESRNLTIQDAPDDFLRQSD